MKGVKGGEDGGGRKGGGSDGDGGGGEGGGGEGASNATVAMDGCDRESTVAPRMLDSEVREAFVRMLTAERAC